MSTTKVKLYSQPPYHDDFNESKNFYRVLYRPGFAVQARELTQMQTMIQAQIDRAGQYAFKDGSRVIKGQVTLNTEYDYIQIEDTHANATAVADGAVNSGVNYVTSNFLADFTGKTIIGTGNSGNQVTAKVLKAVAADSSSGAPITLYLKYVNKGGTNKTVEKFGTGEEFKTTSGTVRYGQVLANGATVNSVATQPIGVVQLLLLLKVFTLFLALMFI